MRRSLLALLLSLVVVPGLLAQSRSSVVVGSRRAPTGTIAGIVRDAAGVPISDVRVIVENLALQTLSGAHGGFVLENLPVGQHTVRFRKLGYADAQAQLAVIADSAITVGVTLRTSAYTLDPVVIEAEVLNQVMGLVLDENDRPMPGVVVEVLGLRTRIETNAAGRYVLLDLKPGNYILQFRAPGYRVSQYGLRMVEQIERDITTKLRRAVRNDRFSVEIAAVVALEAHSRQALRGSQSILIGRDELARFDRAPLKDALFSSRAGAMMRLVNANCLLLNGHETLSASTASERLSEINNARGPGDLFNPAVRSTSASTPSTTNSMVWLEYLRANEVELVEIYLPGSDNSQTLCSRFSQSSGCACPPETSGIVVWLTR